MILEKKSPNELCDGYLIYNPVMGRYYLYPKGVSMDNYTIKESVGKTTYIDCNFDNLGFGYKDEDETWGYYCGLILFSIIGRYIQPDEYKTEWYHIRIEAMK